MQSVFLATAVFWLIGRHKVFHWKSMKLVKKRTESHYYQEWTLEISSIESGNDGEVVRWWLRGRGFKPDFTENPHLMKDWCTLNLAFLS
ncbi:hypothetical protein AVEN_76280-1 [Araneus ventricosus]|uniref:Uncharacterized protein n=1 Tax=Araneus ventricosus TaxID=182803 RepID=A0A4Y2VRB3_ARAVE|nr:hypothetical protein AVEN_76280-1 [Araneus ventricosus]